MGSRSRVWPTRRAALMRSVTFAIPPAAAGGGVAVELLGGRVTVRLYDDRTSAGYKTDYQAVPTRWVEGTSYKANGAVYGRDCRRFSGGRYDRAEAAMAAMVAHVAKLGGVAEERGQDNGGV